MDTLVFLLTIIFEALVVAAAIAMLVALLITAWLDPQTDLIRVALMFLLATGILLWFQSTRQRA